MTKITVFLGYSNSGKDFCARYLANKLQDKKVLNFKFAQGFKNFVSMSMGIDCEDKEIRQLKSLFDRSALDYLIEAFKHEFILELNLIRLYNIANSGEYDSILVTDLRRVSEWDFLEKLGLPLEVYHLLGGSPVKSDSAIPMLAHLATKSSKLRFSGTSQHFCKLQ